MTDSRLCAYRVLKAVAVNRAFSPRALDAEISKMKLSEQDASLAANIVYGTLEKQLLLDRYIDRRLTKKGKLKSEIRIILRLSAYQLLFCDKIPKYSAINEGVELAKKIDVRLGGFVNAVLRGIDKNRGDDLLPDKQEDIAGYLSVRYSVERWIAELWIAELGADDAEKMLASCEDRPPLTARVNTLCTSSDELIEMLLREGVTAVVHPKVPNMLCLSETGSIDSLECYKKGLFHIQDVASAVCCGVLEAEKGQTVYDVCSAPGGKSFTVAQMMQNEGCLRSFDISEKKLGLVKQGAQRLGINILETRVRDAAKGELLPEADRVICDVPCSGLGVIRKKPEIRRKKAEEIAGLPDIQSKILENSALLVKKGGILVYSTCTLVKAENENVVEAFLALHPEFKLLPFKTPFGDECGYMTFRPDLYGTDGFFVARMVKI